MYIEDQWGVCPTDLGLWRSSEYHIVACQGSGVSSETAIQGADKTTLTFSPLKRWHIIRFNILENMAYRLLDLGNIHWTCLAGFAKCPTDTFC